MKSLNNVLLIIRKEFGEINKFISESIREYFVDIGIDTRFIFDFPIIIIYNIEWINRRSDYFINNFLIFFYDNVLIS
jgi:hypothetical protein